MSNKKIMWVHPEYTFELTVPPLVFDVLSAALNLRIAKGTFKKTRSALRGNMGAHIFVFDEVVTTDSEKKE